MQEEQETTPSTGLQSCCISAGEGAGAEVNEPCRLAVKATKQAGARERYGEGGKALEASPLRETGRGSDEQNRRQWLYFRKEKKKGLITAIF